MNKNNSGNLHNNSGNLHKNSGNLHNNSGNLHNNSGNLHNNSGNLHNNSGNLHNNGGNLHNNNGNLHKKIVEIYTPVSVADVSSQPRELSEFVFLAVFVSPSPFPSSLQLFSRAPQDEP